MKSWIIFFYDFFLCWIILFFDFFYGHLRYFSSKLLLQKPCNFVLDLFKKVVYRLVNINRKGVFSSQNVVRLRKGAGNFFLLQKITVINFFMGYMWTIMTTNFHLIFSLSQMWMLWLSSNCLTTYHHYCSTLCQKMSFNYFVMRPLLQSMANRYKVKHSSHFNITFVNVG